MAHKPRPLPAAIAREQEIIHRIAADYGLDFYETIFEMVDFQQMNEIAAYMGFPTRYPHWRWGMEYERMRKSYTYGLHKIYEMVINNDPCYAYLLESNELIDQKIVIAHVYGHCLAPETQVVTAEGIKVITEVRGGDKLLTHTGAYRPVRVTARRWFDGEIYKISVAGSAEPIRITGEHPILLLRPLRRTLPHWQPLSHTPLHGGSAPPPRDDYEVQWVRAAEVQAGDWVALPRRQPLPQAVAAEVPPVGVAQLQPLVAQLAEVLVGDARAGFQGVAPASVAAGVLGAGWADERYEYQPVRSVRTEPYKGFVYNFSVEEDESYTLAAGLLVHNCDFFKNNLWFGKTNRKMMDEMANHATRVWRIIERIGMTEVEEFIDTCLSLENLIDRHAPYREMPRTGEESGSDVEVDIRRPTAPKLRVGRDYMDSFINPPEVLRAEAEQRSEDLRARTVRFPDEPQRDVLRFLLEHAPLERWQRDILEIVRKEAYYFAPQGMTKVGNEGWACCRAGTLVFTDKGVYPVERLVEQRQTLAVSDGEQPRQVYDWASFPDRETVYIRTRRRYELEGSTTHQLMLPNGTWKRLDELQVGDTIKLAGGNNLWATEYVPIDWHQPERWLTLETVAEQYGVDPEAARHHRDGVQGSYDARVVEAVQRYEVQRETITPRRNRRHVINPPDVVDEDLAMLLGYQVGDGHISTVKRTIGLTTGDDEQAERYIALVRRFFGVEPRKKWDPNRWWVKFSSKDAEDFLVYLGMPTGISARIKSVPDMILRSPKPVVASFLRAYFDCDGYAGPAGFILPTASDALGKTIPILLLNFGILSRRTRQKDGCWRIQVQGLSAKTLYEEIGFNLSRKQEALRKYVEERRWFRKQPWEDEIVEIERRRADVYDISVEGTHRYEAQGFINHNSYWHTTIMTKSGVMTDAEVVDYADHHSGTVAMSPQRMNPYKIGLELLRDIEERWNRGQFGKEWDECDDARERRAWDKKLGLGRQKIFEVRRVYNDIGLIDTFFTEDFCNRHQLFTYHFNERTGRYEITSREFQTVKKQLLFSLTNFGQPTVVVEDGNFENRGALLLEHKYEGIELKLDEARDTLKNLFAVWKRPIYLRTVIDETPRLLSFDGKEHATKRIR